MMLSVIRKLDEFMFSNYFYMNIIYFQNFTENTFQNRYNFVAISLRRTKGKV